MRYKLAGIFLLGVAIGLVVSQRHKPFSVVCDGQGHYSATGKYGEIMGETTNRAEAEESAAWFRAHWDDWKKVPSPPLRIWHDCKHETD